jgi:uncharacterized protein
MLGTVDASWPILATLVVLLAAVQSVFGVGLLVFGTPALLLLGMPFAEVLACLLPCSLTVSALQIATTGGLRLDPFRREFVVVTVPALVAAAVATLRWGSPGATRLVVGTMLIASAALRAASGRENRVDAWVERRRRPLLLLLGVVHGVSNLGGGLLTALVGATYRDKVAIRRQIAFCYGAMAGIQLLVLLGTGRLVLSALSLLLPVLAAATYLLVGRWVFGRAGQSGYQRALTALILGAGVLLVAT